MAMAATAIVVAALVLPLARSGGSGIIIVGGSPLLDQPAPNVDLVDVDGSPVSLTDYRGRPVLVHFWATYCVPCRDEFPLLVRARREHAEHGLEILGILYHDFPEGAKAFARDYGAEWPILADREDLAWKAYGSVLLPTTFFVDPDGIVRAFSLGPLTEAGLDQQLSAIIERRSPSPTPPPGAPQPATAAPLTRSP
jgi:cytochrome c biogenesis protein CcmG/thiol:disulfide interchange protein DsbE